MQIKNEDILMIIWIISSPRSGSTFLTDYIGKHIKMYNEPWDTHPLNDPKSWHLPKENIVFKYCENWRNLITLKKEYPDSIWVHCWRNPDDVVYSMAYPKEGSYPPRDLYANYQGEHKLKLCMQRWYSNIVNCTKVSVVAPYIEIKYEDMKTGLDKLSKRINISFDQELDFQDRNIYPDINWDLHPQAKQLRKLVKESTSLKDIKNLTPFI